MSQGDFMGKEVEKGQGRTELSLLMPRRRRGHGPHSSCRVTGFPGEPSRSPTNSSIRSVVTGGQLLGDRHCVPSSHVQVPPVLHLLS